jgi:hypothetical protein
MSAAVLASLLAPALLAQQKAPQAAPPLTIDGKPYVKLATADETRKAMRATLLGGEVTFGRWQMLAPFPAPRGSASLAEASPAEVALARCAENGPGPDLAQKFVRVVDGVAPHGVAYRRRVELEWRDITDVEAGGGADGFEAIEFNTLLGGGPHDHLFAFLHRTLENATPVTLRLQVGSDDGLRLWLDGALLIDVVTTRVLDLNDHHLDLHLAPGLHHLFAKVAQDAGGWSFQMAPKRSLTRAAESALDWQLQLDFPEGEAKSWRVATVAVPEEAELEVGGLELLPDGRPIVATRRGELVVVDGADALPPVAPKLTTFASGLQEPLGIALRPEPRAKLGWSAWVAQRGELTRLVDVDGDLHADLYETVCDGWRISGNYHEYAFGPRFDPDGNAWVTLNLGHTDGPTVMGAPVPTRGCAVRVHPDTTWEIAADGLRSPDALRWLPGVGMAYTDNQGDYVATNKLSPMPFGSFHGHQASLAHRPGRKEGDPVPAITPPAIWFPYARMGQSASDFLVDESGGKFGPFEGQIFVGDQTISAVMRVTLEAVDGVWQGACFPFREGFKSGVHRLAFAKDGSLWVGGTDRGWGARGGRRDALERVVFTGVTPFEMKRLAITSDGFDVSFTQPVDAALAADPKSWTANSWTYEYHPAYGCAELDNQPQVVKEIRLLAPDQAHVVVEHLRLNYVHELHCTGVRSREGAAPLHEVAYYTVNRIPAVVR